MSSHPPTPPASSGRVFLWRLALALVLTTAAAAVGLGGGTVLLEQKFAQARSVRVDLDRALPGSMNILLLGSDSRAFVDDPADKGSFGDTGVVGGQRADVIIIARVEPKSGQGILVSIPRDTLVRLPGYRNRQLINQSFEKGPQGVIDAIKSNFDVPIHHYAEIDFDGFRTMVDAIGGVRMYVPAPSRDRVTGLDIKTAGCVTLDGKQALAWVRSRNYSYYEAGRWRTDPTGDIGRISRQQDFIRRLMGQAIEKGALNPIRANRLANAAMDNLTVDSTFDVKDALRLAQAFRPVGAAGIEMVALPTRPAGAHLTVDTKEAEPILARLRSTAGPDDGEGPPVAPSDVKVRVLNGTGIPGQAGDASADLGAAGFSPAGSGDADTFAYSRTEIRYGSGAQPKAALLARYLGGAARLVSDPTIRGAELVLVTGADWKGVTAPPGASRRQAAPPPTPTTAAPATTTAKGGPSNAPAPAGGPAQPAC